MGRRLVDLTGRRFGRLVVLRLAPTRVAKERAEWVCKCACGTIKQIIGEPLKRGSVKSCGCLRSDNMAAIRQRAIARKRAEKRAPELARQRRAMLGMDEQRGADPPVTRHANAPAKRWDGAEAATRTLSALLLNSI